MHILVPKSVKYYFSIMFRYLHCLHISNIYILMIYTEHVLGIYRIFAIILDCLNVFFGSSVKCLTCLTYIFFLTFKAFKLVNSTPVVWNFKN
jgi:hypothetical protein